MLRKDFRGEIWSNVDPRVMQAMVDANQTEIDGCVGADSYSLRAIEMVQRYFSTPIYATYTINGTGANILAMKAMLDRYSAIICGDETHINCYEAGAFEYTLGNKILVADSEDGKLTVEGIDRLLTNTKKYKYYPKVVVLTQPTELGAVYTPDELKAICDFAHGKGMYVYIDGARIACALATLNVNLTEMIEYADVDGFSIGGTKSGAMFGEMVVFRRKEFGEHLAYLQKQSFQHFDKSKFIGAQFVCLLENDLWLENARKAIENAQILADKFRAKGIEPYYPVQGNMVFAPINAEQLARLEQVFDLHYWNEETKIVRFGTTAFTTEDAMDELVALV